MTSQKSSKNNVVLKDFLRSLVGSIVFPLIALAVLFFSTTSSVISEVTTDSFKAEKVHEQIQMFLSERSVFVYEINLLYVGMVLCGILVAVKSFYFLLSKKQVNVFLSMGITRTTLFVNRVLAGAIALFIGVLVPFLITYLVNISAFGLTPFLTKSFIYLVSAHFLSGLAGFAIGSVAMMISGNIFETGITSLAISLTPTLANFFIYDLQCRYLKGYQDQNVFPFFKHSFLLSPFSFVDSFEWRNGNVKALVPDDVYRVMLKEDYKNGMPAFDKGIIAPLVIWLVIAVVLFCIAFVLFKFRKAENSNSLGHFSISRAIISTFAFVAISDIFIHLLESDTIIPLAITILFATLIAVFLIQIIFTRKIKTTLKSMLVWVVLMGVTCLVFVYTGTECFGTYNKLPETKEIKSGAITIDDSFNFNSVAEYNEYIKSYNADDIAMMEKIFEKAKVEKSNDNDACTYLSFVFETQDGKTISRRFIIYSEDVYEDYLKNVVNSKYYDAVLEYKLLGYNGKKVSPDKQYELVSAEPGYAVDSATEEVRTLSYVDNSMLTYSLGGSVSEGIELIKGNDFAKALYKDLSKMTFEELYKNTEKPIGILTEGNSQALNANKNREDELKADWSYEYEEPEYKPTMQIMMSCIDVRVYPSMKNTIKYLNDNGIDFADRYNGKVEKILYTDSAFSLLDAKKAYANKNNFFFDDAYTTVFSSFQMFSGVFYYGYDKVENNTNNLGVLKTIYDECGKPLKSLDASKFDKVLEKTVPLFLTIGDNGRYVYVIYEDGTMTYHYLPEASLSVLK